MKQFIGEVYTLDANTVKLDREFIEFNPVHSEEAYEATKLSIEEQGQLTPIYIRNGLCVDGRHRIAICKELGISVKAIDTNPNLPDAELLKLCNVSTMTGRQLTSTQRAINAYNYSKKFKINKAKISREFQVRRQVLSYVALLDTTYGYPEVLDVLRQGKAIQLANMDKPSKSIEYITKMAKELHEKSLVVEDTSNRVQFSADAYISTQQGKAWYYDNVKAYASESNQVPLRMLLAELANYKFKVMD